MKILVPKVNPEHPLPNERWTDDVSKFSHDSLSSDVGIHECDESSFFDRDAMYETGRDTDNQEVTYQVFLMSKKRLQSMSAYFTALQNFKEGVENMITLHDISAATFSLFADWFDKGHRDWTNPFCQDVKVLIQAYVLGHRFVIPQFQNFIIDEIRASDSGSQINFRTLLDLEALGFTRRDQIVKYIIDQIAYKAVVSDLWSLTLPLTPFNNDEGPTNLRHLALPLMERIIQVMRQVRPFATDPNGIELGDDTVDPRVDQSKTYHI